MNKKPRIAFCFSWQARTLDQTYIFFKKNLFDAAKEQGFDYDVFCAVEDDEDVDKVNLLKPTKVEKIKSNDVEKIIINQHKTFMYEALNKKYCFIVQKNFKNFLQQLYKVWMSIMIKEDYQKDKKVNYSLVIRVRFDWPLFNKINFMKVLSEISDDSIICIEPKITYPYWRIFHISDCFFIGTDKSIQCLSNIFYQIEKCFYWHEISQPLYIFKYIFSNIKNWINRVNEYQKIIHFPLFFIWLAETYFYTVFTSELCYETYFNNNNIRIDKYKFSNILFRKDPESTQIHLFKKNKYEL